MISQSRSVIIGVYFGRVREEYAGAYSATRASFT